MRISPIVNKLQRRIVDGGGGGYRKRLHAHVSNLGLLL